jgi:hypothetical protein
VQRPRDRPGAGAGRGRGGEGCHIGKAKGGERFAMPHPSGPLAPRRAEPRRASRTCRPRCYEWATPFGAASATPLAAAGAALAWLWLTRASYENNDSEFRSTRLPVPGERSMEMARRSRAASPAQPGMNGSGGAGGRGCISRNGNSSTSEATRPAPERSASAEGARRTRARAFRRGRRGDRRSRDDAARGG